MVLAVVPADFNMIALPVQAVAFTFDETLPLYSPLIYALASEFALSISILTRYNVLAATVTPKSATASVPVLLCVNNSNLPEFIPLEYLTPMVLFVSSVVDDPEEAI